MLGWAPALGPLVQLAWAQWTLAAPGRVRPRVVSPDAPGVAGPFFDVRDGWEPLCTFLNKPVPSTPFPNSNAGRNGLNWVMGGAILRSFKTPSTLSALALVGVAVGLCYSWSKRV